MAPLTTQQLNQYHRMDRDVFARLVIRLSRDPAQSLLVMAMWFWLERNGHKNFISKLAQITNLVVLNSLANEAVTCLLCLESENFHIPIDGGLPLTSTITQKHFSLLQFKQYRFTIAAKIKSMLNNVCARIFTDILYNILAKTRVSPSTCAPWPSPYRPLTVPGFPHPFFGTFVVPPINFEELDLNDPRIWTRGPFDGVSDDDKTMFLTFSRGFPVTEEEVISHFISTYGDCVKALNMGNGDPNDQVLYATLVLKDVVTLDRILRGKPIAKFRVCGKHIWARKYQHRD